MCKLHNIMAMICIFSKVTPSQLIESLTFDNEFLLLIFFSVKKIERIEWKTWTIKGDVIQSQFSMIKNHFSHQNSKLKQFLIRFFLA